MAREIFNSLLRKYQDWGLSIIPIVYKTKTASAPWREYQEHRPGVGELAEWFSDSEPKNIGIVCGKVSGNLAVLDFDKEDKWAEWLTNWDEDRWGSIYETTPVIETGRGYQVYLRTRYPTPKARLDGIDIQGEGSYIVAPPSIHPSGKEYQLINPDIDRILEVKDLAELGIEVKRVSNELERTLEGTREGERNESAFKLARLLRDNGVSLESCKEFLAAWNERNAPPLPARELEETIGSAFSGERGLTQSVREFVTQTHGTFSVRQLDDELGITSRQKQQRKTILARLVREGLIERQKIGCYRIKEPSLPDMDWQNADTNSGLDIKLPFDIHELVEVYPGNILVIAGTTNAGKTAMLLNFIKLNMHEFEIHYFTSELSKQELSKRISRFGNGIEWQFHPHERNSNFDSVIISDAVNIIDYLEPPSGEYYAIADQITAIHNRLTTGIAFIAIQKKRKAELGRGAEFSEERARLYLSMDSGRLKIVKAKNWRTEVNPNGKVYTFKLVDGCNFVDIKVASD